MKINRKKCLHMLGAVYLLYILFYFNIPHFLPDYEEMRAWVSVLMFLLVLGGGIAAVFILLWKLRIKLLLGVQKKFYADTLIGLYAAALMIGIGSYDD